MKQFPVFCAISTLLSFYATYAHANAAQEKYAPCLNYFMVGDSGGCEEEKPKAKPGAPSPTEEVVEETPPAPAGPRPLQERIKEYMEDHGKPPKEYVAFYLEPTIENAVKWVHTYNQILERNKQITYAWGQAERIYEAAQEKGKDLSVLEDPETVPVQDFGVSVEGYKRPESLPYPEGDPRNNPENAGGVPVIPSAAEAQNITLGGISVPTPPNPTPALPNLLPDIPGYPSTDVLAPPEQAFAAKAAPKTAAPVPISGSVGGNQPIQLTYYFSAQCPYCQKFEPEFRTILEELGDKVDVTCVDMTPSGAKQSNINGKIDCAWRPPGLGEISDLGITTTPSLTINRGAGSALERIIGYVEPARIKAYLTTGKVE